MILQTKKRHLIAFIGLLMPFTAMALTANDIAQKVEDRDDGDHAISTITMTLIDKNNKSRIRSMKMYSKDVGDDTQSVIFFLKPSDVKNTAFLTYDYKDSAKNDDQWLYLPALRKTKRIVSSDKSGSFMGSDFSYADMTQRNIKDYQYKIAKETKVGDAEVWIMESIPKNQKIIDETGYTKSYMFVRKDNFVVTRAIHFLIDGKRKYLDVKQMKKIDGIWVNTLVEMKTTKNKITLHKTLLKTENIQFNQKIDDRFFSVRRIEKGL